MSMLRKTVTASLAALTVGATLCSASAPAAAWHRGGWGGPAAAGLLGGFAAGAILGSATRPHGYGYGYGYGYGPAYSYGPEPVYDSCYLARRPVFDAYGEFSGYRRVRVCN